MSAPDPKQPRKKQKEARQPAPNGAERLKTVVRRLPPSLPEDIFWQSVQAWVSDDTVSWKVYCPGKWRMKRLNKEGIPSRAYIAFKDEALVAAFSREYDGHLFRDKAGNESQAVVEFAPFQKVPAEKRKADARNNTIDKDDDYLSFLETLKSASKAETVSLEALIAASQPPPPPTTTPLLEALKAEKSAQKDREAILRNHAHYKDIAASGSGSKKEDAKKKPPVAVAATKGQQSHPSAPGDPPPAPPSKKAKKAAAVQPPKSTWGQAPADSNPAASAGKNQPGPGGAGAAPPSAKSPTPGGHGRHRPPRERSTRGDTASAAAASPGAPGQGRATGPTAPPAPVHAENASSASAPAPGQGSGRKGRPTIGLGRQFEAALSGAGVAVTPNPGSGGERKKRDRDKVESGPAGAAEAKGGKHGAEHGSNASASASAVPSILQRPEGGGQPDAVIMQRPQTEAVGTAAPHGEGGGGGGPRGGGRRGRGRGRGGYRGG